MMHISTANVVINAIIVFVATDYIYPKVRSNFYRFIDVA